MNRKYIFYSLIAFFTILNIIFIFGIESYINLLSRSFNIEIVLSTQNYMSIWLIFAFISILLGLSIKLVLESKADEIKGIKFKTEDGTYGTANWMSDSELENVLGKDNVPGIILGKRNDEVIKLPFDSHFNKNIAVFGSSGSMKTIRFCIN